MKCAIIMAVYKGDDLEYLKEALESLYRQTYKLFDIYVQCDGTIPNTLEVYLDDQCHLGKIVYLGKREENRGFPYTLNELLDVVLKKDYEYIVRMDSDDICAEDRVLKQFCFMENNRDIDVCGSNIHEFYDDGTNRLVSYATTHHEIRRGFARRTAIPHVTAFFRRSFFEKAGLYNVQSNKNEDQWLWLSGFLTNCTFASIAEPLVKVRLSLLLLARRKNFKHLMDTYKLRNKIIKELGFPRKFYLYNVLVIVAKMMPSKMLRLIYKYRR